MGYDCPMSNLLYGWDRKAATVGLITLVVVTFFVVRCLAILQNLGLPMTE